jgi:glyoxylase-like metal-dependent hydrolase (beta-lactamase superfamily II)
MSTESTRLPAPAGSTDPVRAVSVISTGTVEIHPEHALGSRKPLYWWLLTSRKWLPPRPINCYVVEHANGLVLFDTGQDRASVTDPSYFPAGFNGIVYDRLAKFHIAPSETLDAQLGTLGYSTDDVDAAVISHLHQDHIGGIPQLGAELLISPAEWGELSGFSPEARGYLRRHIDVPDRRWKHVDFTPLDDPGLAPFTDGFDVMGDGSIVLLPTPGHTPGSLSMLVRRRDLPPLLMVGDLTYEAALLQRRQLPGVGVRAELGRTTDKVLALADRLPGLVILPAHDPTAARRLIDSTRRTA